MSGSLARVAAQSDDRVRHLPAGLWERMRADPTRAPEHIALAAARAHGPAAAAWLAARRATYAHSSHHLARMAMRRHASLARFGGAATGVGGIVTVVPDLAALAWIQSRMVFFIAAAYGYDPRDPMRPAELLVLFRLYDEPVAARAALDGIGSRVAVSWVGQQLSREEALARRLFSMVGRHTGRHVAGRLIPGLAIVVNAAANERATRRLAHRAIAFYGG
jgi:hypothetical protein